MPLSELYPQGHLLIAAIRVLTHQKKGPPSTADVCKLLGMSNEKGGFICRKLHSRGIIEAIENPFGDKLFIRDYLALENLPMEDQGASMAEEVERFQKNRQKLSSEVESFKQKQAQKQKDLFSKLEKKIKEDS